MNLSNTVITVILALGLTNVCLAQNNFKVIFSEDFEAESFGRFGTINVSSNEGWHIFEFEGNNFTRMNGFGADKASDDWLISPAFNLDFYRNEVLSFDLAYSFQGPLLDVLYSNDYDPELHQNPGTATWLTLPNVSFPSQDNFIFEPAGPINLSNFNGSKFYIAFNYLSTGTGGGDGRVWEVDNFELTGEPPEPLLESDFDLTLEPWSSVSLSSSANWQLGSVAGQNGALINGFGADTLSDDWLISPSISVPDEFLTLLNYQYYRRFDGGTFDLLASTNYDPLIHSDPSDATWVTLMNDDDTPSGGTPDEDFTGTSDSWTEVNRLDLTTFAGNDLSLAFRYTSSSTGGGGGRTWGVDNFQVFNSLPGEVGVNFSASTTSALTIDEITFTADVSGGTEPYSYQWDFGNGVTSSLISPSITYTEAGIYSVTLQVTDDTGTVGTFTRSDYINIEAATEEPIPEKVGDLRIATFNVLLADRGEGEVIADLSDTDDAQAQAVAEIIQRINPDILLLNELDFDAAGRAVSLFKTNYLEQGQNGADPVLYPFSYVAPVNTGLQPESVGLPDCDFNDPNQGCDVPGSTTNDDPEDAFGFGAYAGDFGMAVLSKYPIDVANIRTFQKFLWQDMPNNLLNDGSELTSFYDDVERSIFRLSSKSHWDIPVFVRGETIHVLASHPTPPVFDGSEDRNGRRNHDEIRFWSDYISKFKSKYIYDDKAMQGGLAKKSRFVIMGDQNAGDSEGDATDDPIQLLLRNRLVDNSITPQSKGALENSLGIDGTVPDSADTADFGIRADYVLPSKFGWDINQAGVFWPISTDVLSRLIANNASSDHRLVWVDLSLTDLEKDTDADGIGDEMDNCIEVANSDQRDSNGDGYGNLCDADFNNDGRVNAKDFAIQKADFLKSGDLDTDMNGDGVVNAIDVALARSFYLLPPGPSAKNP